MMHRMSMDMGIPVFNATFAAVISKESHLELLPIMTNSTSIRGESTGSSTKSICRPGKYTTG